MNPLSSLRYLLVFAFLMPCLASAEYVLYKSNSGVLIISNRPGAYFSFDIPGSTITPADLDKSPYPRMFSDAFYLEIVPITLTEPLPETETEEIALLTRRFDAAKAARSGPPSEIHIKEIRLQSNRSALTWSFIPFGATKRFYCLAFRSEGIVFLLKSGFAKAQTKDDPAEFLLAIANSFRRSSTPLEPPKK